MNHDTANNVLAAEPAVNRDGVLPLEGEDPVLGALDQVRVYYLETRETLDRQETELQELRGELSRLQKQVRQLEVQEEQANKDLARERQRAARQKERAHHLATALKNIHRAFYEGNVFSLILKACATITGATRGLYLTAWGEDELRVRATLDMGNSHHTTPSNFVRELCRQALPEGKTFVCNDVADFSALPTSSGAAEQFNNCLVAPVVLMRQFNGVIILADKMEGPFDADDVDMVLHVGDQAAVAVENRRLQDQVLQAYFDLIGVLADAVEAKDSYTHGHCEMVARYGRHTAERMGLPPELLSIVCYGGLLHDVGKIGISDGVLNKPGKLLPEEWNLMRSHVRIGYDLLSRVPLLQRVADVVLHHHERYDGQGYPEGMNGEQISLPARIICVVDAYCAMIAKRSYKESSTPEEARAELIRGKGTQFDPEVVDAFLNVLDEPPAKEECPDGCGLPPSFLDPRELQPALIARPGSKAGQSA